MPPRKADSLKELSGTTRRDRKTRRDPTARLLKTPPPPSGLSHSAVATWRTLAGALTAAGVLTGLDLEMLRLLVQALATERDMATLIETEGVTIATGDGGRKAHPALRAGSEARTVAVRLMVQFGMSPASRQSVDRAPAPPDPNSPWAQLARLQSGRGVRAG